MLKPEEADYEAPLVVFTLLGQASLGVYVGVLVSTYMLQIPLELVALHLSTLLMGIGVLASIFHASRNRLKAYRVIFNFKSSWLSREVGLAAAFLLFLLASTVPGYVLNSLYDATTLIVGFLTLTAMAASYMTLPRPSWSHYNTLVSFYCSTILLGFSLLGFIYGLKYFEAINASILAYHRVASLLIAMAALIRLASLTLYLKGGDPDPVLRVSRELMLNRFKPLLSLEVVFLLLSFVLAVSVQLLTFSGLARCVNALMLMTLPSTSISETTGRMLFYSSRGPPKGRITVFNVLVRSRGLRLKGAVTGI